MRLIEIDRAHVWMIPRDCWNTYEVYNDHAGGVLARVEITDRYAEELQATNLRTCNQAVVQLYLQRLTS